MDKTRFYSARPMDYAAAMLILVLFSAPLFSTLLPGQRSEVAEITKNNDDKHEISLQKDSITVINGMEIEVKDGSVRVLKSDCPRKICSHGGWISQPGQSLVCLPNRVIIEIPRNNSTQFDTVSY